VVGRGGDLVLWVGGEVARRLGGPGRVGEGVLALGVGQGAARADGGPFALGLGGGLDDPHCLLLGGAGPEHGGVLPRSLDAIWLVGVVGDLDGTLLLGWMVDDGLRVLVVVDVT
jgi:hypothetical protein